MLPVADTKPQPLPYHHASMSGTTPFVRSSAMPAPLSSTMSIQEPHMLQEQSYTFTYLDANSLRLTDVSWSFLAACTSLSADQSTAGSFSSSSSRPQSSSEQPRSRSNAWQAAPVKGPCRAAGPQRRLQKQCTDAMKAIMEKKSTEEWAHRGARKATISLACFLANLDKIKIAGHLLLVSPHAALHAVLLLLLLLLMYSRTGADAAVIGQV